jgi:hypothetical protein
MFTTGLVNLYTRDIDAGIRFYRDLLGFQETFRTPLEGAPEHVEMVLGGFKVGLGTVEAAAQVHDVEPEPEPGSDRWSAWSGRTMSTRPLSSWSPPAFSLCRRHMTRATTTGTRCFAIPTAAWSRSSPGAPGQPPDAAYLRSCRATTP